MLDHCENELDLIADYRCKNSWDAVTVPFGTEKREIVVGLMLDSPGIKEYLTLAAYGDLTQLSKTGMLSLGWARRREPFFQFEPFTTEDGHTLSTIPLTKDSAKVMLAHAAGEASPDAVRKFHINDFLGAGVSGYGAHDKALLELIVLEGNI